MTTPTSPLEGQLAIVTGAASGIGSALFPGLRTFWRVPSSKRHSTTRELGHLRCALILLVSGHE